MDIGEMVAELIEAGCAPDVAASVVARAFVAGVSSAGVHQTPVDTAMERRRVWDRERKRTQRSTRLSMAEWLPLVAHVVERDGGRCTYCGDTENLTADHVVPLTRGGTNDPSNLTACCVPCNTKKGNRLVEELPPDMSTGFHPTVQAALSASSSTGFHRIPPDCPPDERTPSIPLENKKEKKDRGAQLAESWKPDEVRWTAACRKLGNDGAERELSKFTSHHRAKATVFKNWNFAWDKWLLNSEQWAPKQAAGVGVVNPDSVNWRAALQSYKNFGNWPKGHGNDPTSPACRAPPELLREFGLELRRMA
jgi:5-methylcytosine-specific restriction endonuclease McrA